VTEIVFFIVFHGMGMKQREIWDPVSFIGDQLLPWIILWKLLPRTKWKWREVNINLYNLNIHC
jgi:hypothetical protein